MKAISRTAFYCGGIRMEDAASPYPVCGDQFAHRFMDENGRAILAAFKDEVKPNASCVARHRIIDDLLAQAIGTQPNLQIILIGAGFDTRAYRLDGGSYVEIDEPALIDYKNSCLPIAESRNPLQRISIDFSTESLADKLLPFSGSRPTAFVVEGVFMYLDQAAIHNLIATLQQRFPSHTLLCDLQAQAFFEKYSRTFHEKILKLGTHFNMQETPEQPFLESGYQCEQKISIVSKSLEWGGIKMPGLLNAFTRHILMRTFLRTMKEGYSVFVFKLQA